MSATNKHVNPLQGMVDLVSALQSMKVGHNALAVNRRENEKKQRKKQGKKQKDIRARKSHGATREQPYDLKLNTRRDKTAGIKKQRAKSHHKETTHRICHGQTTKKGQAPGTSKGKSLNAQKQFNGNKAKSSAPNDVETAFADRIKSLVEEKRQVS